MDDTIGFPDPDLDLSDGFKPHTSHWGVFSARQGQAGLEVRAYAGDPDPNGIIDNFPGALRHQARIAQPAIRRGWLERGPGPDDRRGRDEFVSVSWEKALDLLGDELGRIRDTRGPGAVFGGSYGWASAGRFHHAQSQVHRFLNIAMGGYVRSVNSYSSGASSVLLPQILAGYEDITKRNVTWEQIAADTEIVLAFGGMALKNSMVAGGSISKHVERGAMDAARKRGCEFILVSPLREDLPVEAGAEWMTCVPSTDTALMLGLVHTLVGENLHDQAFLERYTEGWPVFLRYLTGESDGQPKSAEWAAAICGIEASTIRTLARRLAGKRALVTVAHSLQRAEHGEQPVWMGMVLAAALGQIGLPGGGYGYSLGAIGYYGRRVNDVPGPTLGQGRNGVRDFIPVARIADMLLNPGSTYRYDGETRTYPDIRLVYWAGGNPFHHHQDINRLRKAFAKVDTFVVHELAWTATARHADMDAEVLAEICNKLDGIALAIELAAVRVGVYGLREMAALLDSRLKLEWRGRRTAPPRQQTLGATLDWSFGLIGESERMVFQRLAVFAGPFTLKGAIAVATDDGAPADRVVDALEQLVAKSLVSAQPDGASRRYRLLDATRAYAMQKLADGGEAQTIARRHASYVQRTLEAGMAGQGGDPAARLQERASLLADARAALEWSYAGDDGTTLRVPLAGACARLFVELNLLNEARIWSGRALAVLDNANQGGRWELELQSTLGHAFMFTERNSEQAEAALRRGLEIAEALSDHANAFRLLSRLNMFYRRTGDYRQLVPTARQAERIARQIGDTAGIAGSKALLGVSYHLAGDQAEAQAHLDEGVRDDAALRGTQPGHFAYSRTPQIPLARVLWLRGLPDRALDCVRPLVGAAAPRDVVMHCIALCWSSSVFGWVGDWVAVETMTGRLATHANVHGLAPYEAVATGFRAQTMIARGEVAGGIDLLRSALPRLHADRYELYASAFAADLSQGLTALGRVTEGLHVLHQIIARVEQGGGSFDMPELLRRRGDIEARTGDLDAAESSFASSLALAEQQGALSWRLRTEMSLAAFRRQRAAKNPLEDLAATYARFTEGFETADLKAARLMLDEPSV